MAGDYILFSDFLEPGLDNKFKAYLSTLGDIAVQEKNTIIKRLQNMSAEITNEVTSANIKAQENLSKAIGESKKRIEELNTVEKERLRIEKEFEMLQAKLTQANSQEATRNEQLKLSIQKANEERKLAAKLAESEIGSYKRISLELAKNIKEYKSLSEAQRNNASVGGKLLTTIQGQQKSLKEMDATMGNFQRNVGNYNGTIDKAKNLMIGWFAAIGGAMGALKVGKDVIESTDASSDKFAVTVGKMSAAWDYFKKTIASGDFSNFLSNMQKAIDAGAEYVRQLDEIEDRTRALTIAEAETNVVRQAQLKILRDQTKTDDERIAAANKIINEEDALMKLRVSIAQQAKDARIESFKAIGVTEETVKANLQLFESNRDIIKQADEYNEKIKLRKELYNIYSTTTIPLTGKEKDAFEKLNKEIESTNKGVVMFADLRSKYTKLSESELDQLVKLYVDLYNAQASADENNQRVNSRLSSLLSENIKKQNAINGAKNTEVKIQGTINQLKQRQKEIEETIPSLNLETSAGRNRLVDLNKELDRTKELIKQWENLGKLTPIASKLAQVVGSEPQTAEVPVKVTLKPTEGKEKIWDNLFKDIGLSKEEFISSAQELTNGLSDLFSAWNDLLITQAENELNKQNDIIDGLKNQLDEEKALKDAGKANDYDRLVAQLGEEQKLRDEAQKKYEVYQKRQAQLKFLETQANLGLSVAEAFAAGAGEGPAGWIIAIAAAASLVAAFLSMQSQIKSIGQYAEGTEYVDGPGTSKSDSIPARLSKGERIVPEEVNRQLDGIDNDKLPEIYKFYKYNMLRGEGAVKGGHELLAELRRSRMVSEKILRRAEQQVNVTVLPDGRLVVLDGNSTKVYTLSK